MLMAWNLKMLAYKYDNVSRVSPVFYVESAIALVLDITVFNVIFTTVQVVGLVLVIGVFFVIIVSAYMHGDE